uniref:Uncharacterized protein n=1 Tax=Salix viminalis TaxID=40686 RepID=A0A6N2M0P4_SALVM
MMVFYYSNLVYPFTNNNNNNNNNKKLFKLTIFFIPNCCWEAHQSAAPLLYQQHLQKKLPSIWLSPALAVTISPGDSGIFMGSTINAD